MRVTEHLDKISWSLADKATYVLYGLASIAVLRVTNEFEFGIFTLFNQLHNLILSVSDAFALQSILQFSAIEKEKPRVNFIAMMNHIIIVSLLVLIVLISKNSIASIFNQPQIINISNALPLLVLFSIPRYFCGRLLYRELEIFKLFLTNLAYFGSMSAIMFYCIWKNIFLYSKDIIHITYFGAAFATLVSIIVTFRYWKFSLSGATKYLDVVKFSVKYTATGFILPLPKYFDSFLIQFFYGTAIVGLYGAAKNIFRFVDEAINTAYSLIYTPSVKFISMNDKKSLNSLITKSVSLLIIIFSISTFLCFVGVSDYFSSFLPGQFSKAIPIFNILMLSSILLPITLLSTTISASGKPEIVAKYVLASFPVWIGTFLFIGNFYSENILLIPIPYFIFLLILSSLMFKYANRNFDFKFSQLFRTIPDGLNLIKLKINNK